jgi:hypothetical protein
MTTAASWGRGPGLCSPWRWACLPGVLLSAV